ncbi:protein of unknown function [Methylorubrum extorquens DM4]|uniref:Nucleotidyltransferase-like domain-containing protein n=1 Tax=Methylorubrum extorquens (strain DSM 6343 / CIP 106787 / DM4) TaxID=661410 RepID=C7CFY5_METED|nr:protein of unknown function [Methylorubrum extorquens DM4]
MDRVVHWYFDLPVQGKVTRSYVGPQSDPEITKRVEAFAEIKNDLRARRKLVSTLTREAGLPAPERFTGNVVQAMASAGLFRLRGVLVGTVAFQCYPGLLGVRFPSTALQTGDVDFAQFHSVSAAADDTLPPMLDVLKDLGQTFREIPHRIDGRRSTRFPQREPLRGRVPDTQPWQLGQRWKAGGDAGARRCRGATSAHSRLPDLRAGAVRPAAWGRRECGRASAGAICRSQVHRRRPPSG